MLVDSIKFRGHRCFKNHWAGFDAVKPVNLIIGRNNTGKTHLLDLIEAICKDRLKETGWMLQLSGRLDISSLKQGFPMQGFVQHLVGDPWQNYGSRFLNSPIQWEVDKQFSPKAIQFPSELSANDLLGGDLAVEGCRRRIQEVLQFWSHKLSGMHLRRLHAERDISPETASKGLALGPDGHGATNIIRRFILTSNHRFPREVIQVELLEALNDIFRSDGKFSEIQVKVHDEDGDSNQHWEAFLGESKKGLIPLSKSGSGLKTVLLVLINLLVIPKIENLQPSKCVFAFEELENNLHPALLRRLFQYVEGFALKQNATVFLTTHSSVALDVFGTSQNAQIIHVSHDGETARAMPVSAHFDKLGVISELGAKPSDLLQANGIIWLEGPSDCIYMNRWIDIVSKGGLQEGRDYQCAFYGGSLLARTQFSSPEEAEKELVNLFRVNPNIIVVCDGDRSAAGSWLKPRVRRIRAEVSNIPNAMIWVTDAREIENYIPGAILSKAIDVKELRDPNKFEIFFPRKGAPDGSYMETVMNRKSMDKTDLAVLCARETKLELMSGRFDWLVRMEAVIEKIKSWNY
jgi:hypothetical protein